MRTSQKQILILDDDPDIQILLKKILEGQGMHVEEASSIPEALAKALTSPPHLMITDLQIPPATGFDFIAAAKAESLLKSIPIIVLSRFGDRDSVYRATTLGAADYLLKPLKAQLLLQKVRKALSTGEFAKFTFTSPSPPRLRAVIQCTAIALGEASIRIEAPMMLEQNELLQLEGELLDKVGIKNCLFKSTRKFGRAQESGRFISEISIIGATPDVVKAIRMRVR